MQARASVSSWHGLPPCWTFSMTPRLREDDPPPHVSEHALQSFQLDMTQSVGHGCELHSLTCSRCLHSLPPKAVGVTMERWRVRYPWPHVLVQAPSHGIHAESTQSTGHMCVLHACVLSKVGHCLPPNATAVVMLRVRFW